jgi:hypothetical protein
LPCSGRLSNRPHAIVDPSATGEVKNTQPDLPCGIFPGRNEMLTSQRRQAFPIATVIVLAIAGLITATALVYRARVNTEGTITADARVLNAGEHSEEKPSVSRSTVPRLTTTKPSPRGLGVPIDMPYPHGGYLVSFSKPERRSNEDEEVWGYRVQFIDQYQRFIREGKVGPAQENAIRGVFADTQIALDAHRRARDPEGLDSSAMVKLQIEAEKDIEKTMRRKLNAVLNAEQRSLLQNRDFMLLRVVNTLAFAPLTIEKL